MTLSITKGEFREPAEARSWASPVSASARVGTKLRSQFLNATPNDYPRSGPRQQVAFQISPAGISQNQGDIQWRLSTIDQMWSVVLSSTRSPSRRAIYLHC